MKNWRHLIIAALFTLAAAGRLSADFEDTGAGARSIALGNAFTAVADDAFSLYYNPAGLGFIRTAQIGADFGKLTVGLDDGSNLLSGFTAIVIPFEKVEVRRTVVTSTASTASTTATTGTIEPSSGTVVAVSTQVVTSAVYRPLGALAAGMRYFSLAEYYQEAAYYLAYGRPVGDRWAWGVSAKYLQEKYVMNDYLRLSPVFDYGQKDSVSAVSADIGFLYNLAPRFFLGLAAQDITQPDLGLKEEDRLPMTGRLGLAWKEKDSAWALDTVYRQKKWYYSAGFERIIRRIFGLRMGITYGGQSYLSLAGGFGVNLRSFQLDYVFQVPLNGLREISGTHRMSFLFRFGRRAKDEIEVGSLEYYYDKVSDELASTKQQLLETTTEKENLERILIEESTLRIRERIEAAKAQARRGQASSAAAASREESREPKEIRHIVRKGDTLQSIAQLYYGEERRWSEIYQANRDKIGRGGTLKVNDILLIPSQGRSATEIPVSREGNEAAPVREITPVKVILPGMQGAGEKAAAPETAAPVKIIPLKVGSEGAAAEQTKAPANEAAKPKVSGPRRHVVQPGENLRSIAQKYYGDGSRWKDIYRVNKDKVIGGQVSPGQEITIP